MADPPRREKKRKSEDPDRAARKAAKKARKAARHGDSHDVGYAQSQGQAASNDERSAIKVRTKHSSSITNGNAKKKNPSSTSKTKDPYAYEESAALTALPQTEIDAYLQQYHISIQDPQISPLRPVLRFEHISHSSTFRNPTPIQSAAWPHLLSGRDVIGVAETGSGKTIAFGLPCVRLLADSSDRPGQAVIVSPTRELASQIHEQLEELAKPFDLEVTCLTGGVPKGMQQFELKTANIIVATPGRLNDLIEEGHANLRGVRYVVLDEADRMLDKGFEAAIRTILAATPSSAQGRQTCMFTATWPTTVRELAASFMRDPVHISIGADNPTGELRANKAIVQRVEVMDGSMKEQRLRELLQQHKKAGRVLVFCLYKKEAARVEDMIRRRCSVPAAGIHGDMAQPARTASLEAFKSGKVTVLVATDVAARGLDIPNVKLVINVTFPLTVEDYVHRIGRTGRAGADGLAVTFFTDHDKALAGGLVNVLKAAQQEVPEALLKYGTTVKKKQHESYGAFYREPQDGKTKGTVTRFD